MYVRETATRARATERDVAVGDGDGDGDASTVDVRDGNRRGGRGVRRRRVGGRVGEVRPAEGEGVGHREGRGDDARGRWGGGGGDVGRVRGRRIVEESRAGGAAAVGAGMVCGPRVRAGRSRAGDAFEATTDSIATSRRYASERSETLERSELNALGTFVFQWESSTPGKSVFTRENVLEMRELERVVTSRYDAFCQMRYDAASHAPLNCVPPLSPIKYFFPSVGADGGVVYDGEGELVTDVDEVVRNVFVNDTRAFGYFLGDFDPDSNVVGITRAKYFMGAPFQGFTSASDRSEAQEEVLKSFLDPIESELFRRFGMSGSIVSSPYMSPAVADPPATLITRWDAEYLRQKDAARVIASDLAWTIGSIGAVWLYIAVNTQSFFIAFVGMFEILISFPIALLIYRLIFRIEYVGNITALSIFILLGLGADDIFVYFDAYRQSAHEPGVGESLSDRLLYSSRRASKAIFVTSLTTTGAFLATAWSSITPLAGFGIMSATMISVVFVLHVFLFPPALVIYARHFEQRMMWHRLFRRFRRRESDDSKRSMGQIERFFHDPFYRALDHRWLRLCLICGFVAMFVTAAKFCLRLETPSKLERWYSSKHMTQQFSDREQTAFMRSNEDIKVHVDVFWGLDGADTSGVNRWNLDSRGRLRLEDDFDVTSEAAQMHILNSCAALRHAPCSRGGCLDNALTGDVRCFMEAFREYVGAENFPVPREEFLARLWEFRTSASGSTFANDIGFRDSFEPMHLFFVRVSAISTLPLQAPASVSRVYYDAFERLVDGFNSAAPKGVESGSQTAYVAWTWMRMQETLVENTFQGISICFCMAFFILCVSTGNLLIASTCSACVAGVVVSVLGLGIYKCMHWDLGIRETIAAVILIGLSVDYGIHLGNAYVESPPEIKTRRDKTRYALRTMGVSIVSSAITTTISGSILWLCTLAFFSKFAFLITSTMFFAVCWSLCFIPLVLMELGPEDDDWKIQTLYRSATLNISRLMSRSDLHAK